MAATINDKFNETTNGTRPDATTVTGTRSAAGTTLQCAALTGWPTATAVHFATYRTDAQGAKVAGSQCDWKGIVSGTQITNLTLKAGTDVGNAIGETVVCMPTAAWADDVVEGISVSLDQDGTLKAGAVDVAGVLASNVVTTAKILDANVTTAKLATTSGEIAGTWQSWTPTFVNWTIGTGGGAVTTAKYLKIGKTVHFRLYSKLGSSGQSVGSNPTFTLPVNLNADYVMPLASISHLMCYDSGGPGWSSGYASTDLTPSADKLLMIVDTSSASYTAPTGLTASVPFVWAAGDAIFVSGTYESV